MKSNLDKFAEAVEKCRRDSVYDMLIKGRYIKSVAWPTAQGFKSICSYCEAHIRGPKRAKIISHGICKACAKREDGK